jgi:hypothetical protein
MKRLLWVGLVTMAFVPTALVAFSDIKDLKLADGHDTVNKIAAPLFDAGAIALTFSTDATFNRSAKIVRRAPSSMFTRGPEYTLDKNVDIAKLFNEALGTESTAMGFKTATGGDGWKVSNTIKDIYMESRQIPYGPTLFYGYMDVAVQATSPRGTAQAKRLRFHSYFGAYNAGLGRKDEASEALAHLLVESAQELIARMNREAFHAPTHRAIAARVKTLESGVTGHENDLHMVGLSNSSAAVPVLMSAIPKDTSESRRSSMIDALARLGAADAVTFLAGRYPTEDEDCRWYSLKAMDYIGGTAALAVLKDVGAKDKDGGPRRLAERILAPVKP